MFLKRLEIFGFKSFPEKTVFTFNNDGVTVIVGPNGCGKSNVSDAIKWVIGEQKAKALRGTHMLDVIFNGSESIKALGMAEVSLVLDNSAGIFPMEFSEIKITRKLYRSGESDYLLNKKPRRLKDITELLMDTGLGSDSYSVIEQGRMDRVLTSKPEERRFVFEEAAGITKYKAQRKEALRKLERTSDNLVRVNDILTEVTRQMNLIERQARKAQCYKEFFDELKRLDVKVQRERAKELGQGLFQNTNALARFGEQDRHLHQSIVKIEKNVVDLRHSLEQLEQEIEDKQAELNKATSAFNVLENQIAFNQNKIRELEQSKEEKIKEIKENDLQMTFLQSQKDEEEQSLEQCRLDIKALVALMENDQKHVQQAEIKLHEHTHELDEHKKDILELVTEQSRNKDYMAHREYVLKTQVAKKDDLLEQKEGKEQRKKKLACSSEEVQKRLDTSHVYLKDLEGQRDRLQQQETDLEHSIEQKTELISEKRAVISAQKSQLIILEDMHRNYEGYSQGTKEILKKRDVGEGVYKNIQSDFASMLSVKDDRYEVAIEAVLGQYAQSIVVTSTNDLPPMMNHLKDQRIGRAAFVALDIAKGLGFHATVIEQCSGFVARAIQTVSYDQKYDQLLQAMLGNIFVFQTFQDMVQAFHKTSHKTSLPQCKFVSLNGEVLEGTGTIIGGASASINVHVIGREQKIQGLCKQLKVLECELLIHEAALQSSKGQLQDLKQQLHNKRQQIEEKNKRVHQDEQELSRYQLENQHLSDQVGQMHGELGKLSVEEETLLKDIEQFKQVNRDLDEQVRQLQQEQQYFEECVQLNQAAKEKTEVTMTEHKVSLATLEEKVVALQRHSKQLADRSEDEFRRKQNNTKALDNFEAKREQLAQDILSHQDQVVQARFDLDQWQGAIRAFQEKRRHIYQDLQDQEKHMQEYRNQLMDLQKFIKEQEVQKYEIKLKLDAIKERVFENYQLEWSQVLHFDVGEFETELDKDERLQFLKNKISRIGSVNTEAIAEFDILKERHGFLSQQITDLLEAKEALLKVIAQVNKESRKRFREAFDQINQHFKELFKILFGGGHAELHLLNENDVLESGIEVVVSPPGKKMQSITLMSGGERAMTGIALLFAMFRVNPSPFCVLDEIDAPLDESNVDRFIDIMNSFKEKTQFIVITHNKKTMAKADVIYGVTMQKPGVSKSIAIKMVDFAKHEHEHELVTA